jgi:hypothetical protein
MNGRLLGMLAVVMTGLACGGPSNPCQGGPDFDRWRKAYVVEVDQALTTLGRIGQRIEKVESAVRRLAAVVPRRTSTVAGEFITNESGSSWRIGSAAPISFRSAAPISFRSAAPISSWVVHGASAPLGASVPIGVYMPPVVAPVWAPAPVAPIRVQAVFLR